MDDRFERVTRCYAVTRELRLLADEPRPTHQQRARRWLLRGREQFLPHYVSSTGVPGWRLAVRRLRRRGGPDFAAVTALKAGSSDLAARLMCHPSVIAPLAKEIVHERPEAWRPYYPTAAERQRVAAMTGRAVSGCFGPFATWERLPEILAAFNPEARVVLLLRDPVARAFSQWKWELFLGGRAARARPDLATFERCVDIALAAFPSVPLPTYSGCGLLESGLYAPAVARWFDRFGRDRVLVLDAAAYFLDPAEILDRIQAFLDLPRHPLAGPVSWVNSNPMDVAPVSSRIRDALARFYAQDLADLRRLTGMSLAT